MEAVTAEQSETAREMTLEEWANLEEDVEGELVDGFLEEEEDVGFAHEVVVSWLVGRFRDWIIPQRGFAVGSDAKYGVRPRRGRKPDISVFFPGRRPPAEGLITIPPDIAVEVLSPAPKDIRRDRIHKLEDYAVFGVKFYWIVDRKAQTLEIFELGSDRRYVRALAASEERLERVPGCEGLVLELSSLWAELRSLESPD